MRLPGWTAEPPEWAAIFSPVRLPIRRLPRWRSSGDA